MNTGLLIVICILGFIALVLLIGLFISKEMSVESKVVINQPKQQVFDYIKYVKNQDNYSVWNRMDPDMKKEYRGTDGQVGFIYTWDSNKNKNVGAGEEEIKKIVEGESISFELRFKRPMENVAHSDMYARAISANQTEVRWTFEGTVKYPMTIMKGMFRNMLGKAQQEGLNNLKAILEKSAK